MNLDDLKIGIINKHDKNPNVRHYVELRNKKHVQDFINLAKNADCIEFVRLFCLPDVKEFLREVRRAEDDFQKLETLDFGQID